MTDNALFKRLLEIVEKDFSKSLKEYKPKLSRALGAVSTRQIRDAAITTAKYADSSITAAKYADSSIPFAKISFDINRQLAWYEDGVLSVGTSKGPLRRIDANVALVSCYIYVKTAPTGAAIIVDVLKSTTPNGAFATIFSSVPQIAATTFSGNSTGFASVNLSAGDYLRFDITQVGSTVAGSSLTCDLNLKMR